MTQTLIGQVLATLGARENDTVRLEQAAAAFREALKERTRERAPLDWASTQGTLAAVLAALGARESGTARLHEASVAYREALKEQTRERATQQFALIQTGLGGVLVMLAEREGGTAYLDEAVAAYRAALQATTEDGGRLDLLIKLAEAKASLGYALYDGGDFAAASLNFREAAALNFRDLADGPSAYPMLWLYLADTRSGAKDAKSHLQESATRLKPGEWPFPVVELYLGRRSPGGMITPGMTPAERCEAQFYLGQWHLLQKKRADAIQALRSAVESCPKDFNEYAGAVAELKRLGQ
jgi:tetratricopeptide (TPR) repeat protein